MVTKAVAISGTVGKQVYPTSGVGAAICLKGFNLSPLSAAAFVRIRDGNASGNIEFEQSVPANTSYPIILPHEGRKFSKGMHVKVLGTGAQCFLWVE
jgi:hypothetical protein